MFLSLTCLLIVANKSSRSYGEMANEGPKVFSGGKSQGVDVVFEDNQDENGQYYEQILNDIDDEVYFEKKAAEKERPSKLSGDDIKKINANLDKAEPKASNTVENIIDIDVERVRQDRAKAADKKVIAEAPPKANSEIVAPKPAKVKKTPPSAEGGTVKMQLGLFKSHGEAVAGWFRVRQKAEFLNDYDYFIDKITDQDSVMFSVYVQLQDRNEAIDLEEKLIALGLKCKVL